MLNTSSENFPSNSSQEANSTIDFKNTPKKSSLSMGMILGLIALVLMVVGASAAYFLGSSSQDIRNRASTGDLTEQDGKEPGLASSVLSSLPSVFNIRCSSTDLDPASSNFSISWKCWGGSDFQAARPDGPFNNSPWKVAAWHCPRPNTSDPNNNNPGTCNHTDPGAIRVYLTDVTSMNYSDGRKSGNGGDGSPCDINNPDQTHCEYHQALTSQFSGENLPYQNCGILQADIFAKAAGGRPWDFGDGNTYQAVGAYIRDFGNYDNCGAQQSKQISGRVYCAATNPTEPGEKGRINVPIITTDAGASSMGTAKTVAGGGYGPITLTPPSVGEHFALRVFKIIKGSAPDKDPAFVGAGGGVCNPFHENCSYASLPASTTNMDFTTTVRPTGVTSACVENTNHLTFRWNMARDTQNNLIRNYIVRLDNLDDGGWNPAQGGNANDYYFLVGLDQPRVGSCTGTTCTFNTDNLKNQFSQAPWNKPWASGKYSAQIMALSNYSQNSGGGIPAAELYDNLVELCSATSQISTCTTTQEYAFCEDMTGKLKTEGTVASENTPLSYSLTLSNPSLALRVDPTINPVYAGNLGWVRYSQHNAPLTNPITDSVTFAELRQKIVDAGQYTDKQAINTQGIRVVMNVVQPDGSFCDGGSKWVGGPNNGQSCTNRCLATIKLAPLACGAQGCTTDASCATGLKCVTAGNGNKYCANLTYETACAANPSTASCCNAPLPITCKDKVMYKDAALTQVIGATEKLTVGQTVYFAININVATGATGAVTVTDVIPNGLTFVSAGQGCTHNATTKTVSCSGTQAVTKYSFAAKVTAAAAPRVSNTATVVANGQTTTCSVVRDVYVEGPRCLNISRSVSTPKLGDQVRFTCTPTISGTSLSYEFRAFLNGQLLSTPLNPAGSSNVSLPLNVTQIGSYTVQCRVCIDSGNDAQGKTCENWQSNVPVITGDTGTRIDTQPKIDVQDRSTDPVLDTTPIINTTPVITGGDSR